MIRPNCKGLVFKLRKSSYRDKNKSLVFKQEFYFMRSLSCNACEFCDYLNDQLDIDICEHNDPWLSNNEQDSDSLYRAILYDEYEAGLEKIK